MTLFDYILPLAPEFVLLIGACAVLIAGLMQSPRRGGIVAGITFGVVVLALIVSIVQGEPNNATAIPGIWVSSLSWYARLIGLSVGALIVLVNWSQPSAEECGEYMSMLLLSLLGILMTASANDLVVLFFAIELVSIPTYVLIALSRQDIRASEATVKYFFLGALSAAILAYGLTFLYGAAGTTTIFAISSGGSAVSALVGDASSLSTFSSIGLLLVFAGLAFKVAAVPFHVYVPDVYEGAASPVTGLLGFVPKFAGFLALVKILSAFNWALPTSLMWMIWLVAAATMTVGNVMALLQDNAKRMLAYSSIAHTGYMLIALLVGPVAGAGPLHDGVAALLLYIAIYGAMNLGVFAVLSSVRIGDREAETLDDLAGLARRAPLMALALAICVFSLMGFPPTAGFLGKLYVFSSAFSLEDGHVFQGPLVALAVIALINTAISAAYYLRIITTVYVREPAEDAEPAGGMSIRWALGLCAAPMLLLFIWPSALVRPAQQATESVRNSIRNDASRVTVAPDTVTITSAASITAAPSVTNPVTDNIVPLP